MFTLDNNLFLLSIGLLLLVLLIINREFVKKSTSKELGIVVSRFIKLRKFDGIFVALVLNDLFVSNALVGNFSLARDLSLLNFVAYQLLKKFMYIVIQLDTLSCTKSPVKTISFCVLGVAPLMYKCLLFIKSLIVVGSGNNLESKTALSRVNKCIDVVSECANL